MSHGFHKFPLEPHGITERRDLDNPLFVYIRSYIVQPFIYSFICPCYLSNHISVYRNISIYVSVYPWNISIYISVYLWNISIYILYICLSMKYIHLYSIYLSIYEIYLSIYEIYPSFYLFLGQDRKLKQRPTKRCTKDRLYIDGP